MDNSVEDESNSSTKCTLIDKIIGSMKSEFNKNLAKENEDDKKIENNKIDENNQTESNENKSQKDQEDLNNVVQKEESIVDTKIENGNLPNKNVKKNKVISSSAKEVEDNISTSIKIEEKLKVIESLSSGNSSDSDKEVGYDPIADEFRGFDNKTKNLLPTKETSVSPKRNLRSKTNIVEPELKRSARRRSKDCTESVLQSAIARKEKSYNETVKPQRLSRRLKPTPKILANLEQCQKDSIKNEKKLETKKISSPRISRDRKSSSDKKSESDQKSAEEDVSNLKEKEKTLKRKRRLSRSSQKKQKCSNKIIDESQENSSKLISESDNSTSSPLEDEEDNKNILEIDKSKIKRKSSDSSDGRPARRSVRKIMQNQETDIKPEIEEVTEPLTGSVAEQDLSPNVPESTTVENTKLEPKKCLCQNKSQFYLANNDSSEIIHCGALDSIDGKIIGCNNTITKEFQMLRPSTRVPYATLCEVHKERLIRHNCCPTCGLFCTQGRFTQCSSNHQYHRECQLSVDNLSCCPHCALESPSYDVMVTMHCSKEPIFLPKQKNHYPSAKMSFTKNKLSSSEVNEEDRVKSPPLVPPGAIELRYLCNPSESREKYDLKTLFEAIKENNCEEVATILGTGDVNLSEEIPDTDGYTLLHYASHEGLLAIVHMLIVAGSELDLLDKDQNTPLMVAILAFKNSIVKYLVKSGASITIKGTDGMSALHLAAKSGNLEACQYLIDATSDVRTYVNSADDGGWTPLVWACEHGHESVVKYLLQNHADPTLRDVEQNIALHWATFSGSSKITEMLLNSGCDVLAVNAHGDSPLHIAARQEKYNCILILLARGSNVHLKNKSGETPLDCCVTQPGDCYTAISLNVQLQSVTADIGRKPTILTNDISKGKELNPIQCINTVDDEPIPTDFVYITKNCFTSDIQIDNKITSLQSCSCEEKCLTSDCKCNHISLGCWYDEEGKLIPEFNYADPPMLFECNLACNCNAITCNNRVVQNGLTQRFQLFRTKSKGWGIKTLRFIPKGAYVCEYIGEILSDSEADHREDDSYLFDLDNRVCIVKKDGETYCIDARRYGNLSRFINHNCEPNLLPGRVFIEHQDLRFPRIAFFANRDIEANEELGFDYGDKFWIIKYKSFTCMCGKESCKYSESTIKITLENYNKKLQEEAALILNE